MAETEKLGLPLIEDNMTADIPRDHNALANAIDNVIGNMQGVPTTAKEVAGAITELFQSGVDGKNQLEAAVIAKEGTVSKQGPVATFDELEAGIMSIPVGPDTSDATVAAGDLRAGKIAYGKDGARIVGAVPVQTGGNVVPGPNDIVKAAGIYDTPITVKGVVVPADKVLAGTTIAGTAGTMPNRAGDTAALSSVVSGTTLKLLTSQGYRDGLDDYVTITDPNFIAANIRAGTNIFGLSGTLNPVQVASGSKTTVQGWQNNYYYNLFVTGLSFTPRIIFAWDPNNTYGAYLALINDPARPHWIHRADWSTNKYQIVKSVNVGTSPPSQTTLDWQVFPGGFCYMVYDNTSSVTPPTVEWVAIGY
jgi:hypothetical protein